MTEYYNVISVMQVLFVSPRRQDRSGLDRVVLLPCDHALDKPVSSRAGVMRVQ